MDSDNNPVLIVAALAISIFFVRFDAYIVNIAMPTFVDVFKVSVSQASWIALSYVLSQVSAVMLFGKLCSQFRLKNIFLLGMAIFTVASLLCGISPDFWSLIVFRCVQGLGGSMMLVSAYAAVLLYLPQKKVGWGLSIMTTAAAIGVLLGPVTGGLIIARFSWHWIFLINFPLGIMALVFCYKVIPDAAGPEKRSGQRLDIAGLMLSAAALFLLVYSLNMGCEHGWASPLILGCELFSIIFFVAFFAVEARSRNPLLDMSLFATPVFAIVLLSTIIGFLLFFGGNFLLPFYLTHQGLNPAQIGFLLMAFSIVYIPIGLYAGHLTNKFPSKKISAFAMFFASVTSLLFAADLGDGVVCAVIYLVMLAVSYGMFFVPINHCIMSFASEKNRGSVSAVFNTSMNIAMAMGIAVMETIYSEFKVSVDGFRASFISGGIFCFIAALMLMFFSQEKTGDHSK
ncbi:MAG TPA: MFS transporter [Syntrophorhabdaceae bacterium]|nr:MFS transporter [Syntrophorhabdaceae bacterium]